MTTSPQEPPRRPFGPHGPTATVTVTALGLALVAGSALGVITGAFGPLPEGQVVNPDFSVTASPAEPAPEGAVRSPARPGGRDRHVTTLPPATPTAAPTAAPTTLLEPARSASTPTASEQTGAQPVAETPTPDPCPSGYVPDDKGGCLVDHSGPGGTPPPRSKPAAPDSPTPKPGGGPASQAAPSARTSGGIAG